jgi:hypothetical protein
MSRTDFDVVTGPSMAQRRSEVPRQPSRPSDKPAEPTPLSRTAEKAPDKRSP